VIDEKVIEEVINAITIGCMHAPSPIYSSIDVCIETLLSTLGRFVLTMSRKEATYYRTIVLKLWGSIYDTVMSKLEKMGENRTALLLMMAIDIFNDLIASIIETKDEELVLTDVAYSWISITEIKEDEKNNII